MTRSTHDLSRIQAPWVIHGTSMAVKDGEKKLLQCHVHWCTCGSACNSAQPLACMVTGVPSWHNEPYDQSLFVINKLQLVALHWLSRVTRADSTCHDACFSVLEAWMWSMCMACAWGYGSYVAPYTQHISTE